MKVKKYLLTAFLLTLLLFLVMAGSLLIKHDVNILIMLNFCIMEYAAGSWILMLIDVFLYLKNKPYIPGIKSYKILTVVIFIADFIFGIVNLFKEKTFRGSSAEMMLIYLLPMLAAVWIILDRSEKNTKKRGNGK